MSNNNKKGSPIGMMFMVGAAVGVMAFIGLQFTTKTVYVATTNLDSGTKITEDLISSGAIKAKSVPKSLTNNATIDDFREIENGFIKYPLAAGQVLNMLNLAQEGDIRNHPEIKANNLEALTLSDAGFIGGLPANINKEDKVNLYNVQEVEIEQLTGSSSVRVGELPTYLSEMFKKIGKEDTDMVSGTYRFSKLIAQNVPVVDVIKDESLVVTNITLGVTPNIAEAISLGIETGGVTASILPYSDKEYEIKESDGAITNFQMIDKTNEKSE